MGSWGPGTVTVIFPGSPRPFAPAKSPWACPQCPPRICPSHKLGPHVFPPTTKLLAPLAGHRRPGPPSSRPAEVRAHTPLPGRRLPLGCEWLNVGTRASSIQQPVGGQGLSTEQGGAARHPGSESPPWESATQGWGRPPATGHVPATAGSSAAGWRNSLSPSPGPGPGFQALMVTRLPPPDLPGTEGTHRGCCSRPIPQPS